MHSVLSPRFDKYGKSDRENYATAISLRIYLLKCLRKSSAMAFPRPLKFGIFWEGYP